MIEKVKKVNILVDKDKENEILDKLFHLNLVHISSFKEEDLNDFSCFTKPISKTSYQEELYEIDFALSIFKQFGVGESGFFKSFFPDKQILLRNEFDKIVENFNLKDFYRNMSELSSKFNLLIEEENVLKEEKNYINIMKSFPFQYSIFSGTKLTKSICFTVKNRDLAILSSKENSFLSDIFFYPFETEKDSTKAFILYLNEDDDRVNSLIKKYNVSIIPHLENITGFIEEEVERINLKLTEIEKEKTVIKSKIKDYYKFKINLLALKDFYNSLKFKDNTLESFLQGKEVALLKGFVKEIELNKILAVSNDKDCIVMISDPEKDDIVPVSLRNIPLFRPFEFLVKLFGVPSYSNVDPVPVIAVLFSLFFGIALGDAIYGLVLVAFGFFFRRKYREDAGAHNFFSILLYGGIVSIIVGILTGSFAGNLFELYFPSGAITGVIKSVRIIDTLSATGSVNFLIFAIGTGVVTQLLGVIINIITKIKGKNYLDAIFNGVGWLLFLPGLVLLLLLSKFPFLKIFDYSLIIVGVILLLLGGWNSVHSFMFKPVAALVNIYGIRSSYGVTSFLGDTLSYSRLFALGLSSSILASSFNMMAQVIGNMFGGFGIVPLLLVLIATQSLALMMSVLGAFIHSMRLNFLEFFGRFYDIGGYEFKPLGFEFKNIIVDNKEEVKNNGKHGNSWSSF
jgi:V/A-type H+-transporting ATPase subunit I